jgi:hypothetical protein
MAHAKAPGRPVKQSGVNASYRKISPTLVIRNKNSEYKGTSIRCLDWVKNPKTPKWETLREDVREL